MSEMKRISACVLIGILAVGHNLLSQQTPRQTAQSFKAAEGLEVTLWAAEPDVINPTNIDIDARGRVWVLEAVNYRRTLSGQKDLRPSGDRITILEDSDGDGKADKTKIFAQDPSLRSPLGIAVLGDKVIVSQSPDLIVFTKDERDNIVKKEVLLTGWKGFDHDHGVHAVVFGPDGRYYLNSGDTGFEITDRSGQHFVSSRSGPYYAGCALRVNPDGTGFAVLGHNFRNPYELALDSFGNIWQTDNDDDGNKWVRINYVMEGGNFGFWGPGGRKWKEDKGTHFHSELPGVVPNVARTGAGAPCGLVVYEGKLLPPKYRGQLIHAEAGKRLINTFFVEPDGAGYSVRIENTVESSDTWFRPSDVCVSPDGAVFIADWYDPSVGGHLMQDSARGRIYRLAPQGHKPSWPPIDFGTTEGLAAALGSPAQSVRYLGHSRLKAMGSDALRMLEQMYRQGDPIVRARALWLLGRIPGHGEQLARRTLQDPDPNFRILAIRVLRLYGANILEFARPLIHDPSPQVRREIAVALQEVVPNLNRADASAQPSRNREEATTQFSEQEGNPLAAALDLLLELSKQFDGKDRWYLEALGMAARGKENVLYPRLRSVFEGKWNSLLGQLLWEFRPSDAASYLISCVNDPSLTTSERAEALDALAAIALPEAGIAVAELMAADNQPPELANQAFKRLSRQLFSEWIALRKNPALIAAIKKGMQSPALQAQTVILAEELEDTVYGAELLVLSKSGTLSEEIRAAAIRALGRTRDETYLPELEKLSQDGPLALRVAAVRALGYAKPAGQESRFRRLVLSQAPNEVRAEAVKALSRSDAGVKMLLDLEQLEQLPSELRGVATSAAHASSNTALKRRAEKLLPPFRGKDRAPLPPIQDLYWRTGEAERGRKVFMAETGPKCVTCHGLGDGKKKAGPDLSSIGEKMGKQALLEAILNPSSGIAPEYYLWILDTKSQGLVTGIIVENTPQRVTVQIETGEELRFKPSEIKSRRRSRLSLMPEDLAATMTEAELVDLVEFLTTLISPDTQYRLP